MRRRLTPLLPEPVLSTAVAQVESASDDVVSRTYALVDEVGTSRSQIYAEIERLLRQARGSFCRSSWTYAEGGQLSTFAEAWAFVGLGVEASAGVELVDHLRTREFGIYSWTGCGFGVVAGAGGGGSTGAQLGRYASIGWNLPNLDGYAGRSRLAAISSGVEVTLPFPLNVGAQLSAAEPLPGPCADIARTCPPGLIDLGRVGSVAFGYSAGVSVGASMGVAARLSAAGQCTAPIARARRLSTGTPFTDALAIADALTARTATDRDPLHGARVTASAIAILYALACDGSVVGDPERPAWTDAGIDVHAPPPDAGGEAGGAAGEAGAADGPDGGSVASCAPPEAPPSPRPQLCGPDGGAFFAGRVCALNRALQCEPVRGARVGFRASALNGALCSVARTGADGRYVLAGVEPTADCADYHVMVSAEGFNQAAVPAGCVGAGATRTVDVNLEPSVAGGGGGGFATSSFAGRVCRRNDSGQCEPVAAASVAYRRTGDDRPIASGATDAEGRFTLPCVEPVSDCAGYTLMVSAPRFNQTAAPIGCVVAGNTRARDFDLAPSPTGGGDFRSSTIAGRVCVPNAAGGCDPVADAVVSYRETSGRDALGTTTTDAAGRFALVGVRPSADCAAYTVTAIVTSRPPAAVSTGCVVAGDTRAVDIRL